MVRTIITVLSVIICTALQAQTMEEIAARYPDEHAVVLNDEETINIFLKNGQPYAEIKNERTMLILDDKANGIYNSYSIYHGTFNKVSNIEAYTKVPSGNKFTKIKVTDIKTESASEGSVFYDDVKQTSFSFPSLVKGAETFLSYDETFEDMHLFNPFYFASYLPVIHSKYTVNFPAGFELKYTIKNDTGHVIQFTEDTKGRTHTYEFSAAYIKSFRRFADAPSYRYYEPHVILQIASYKDDNGNAVNFLGTLDDLYKWNYNFISRLDNTKDEVLKKLADSLTTGLTAPADKAVKIYNWVQQNIKYVAFEDGLEGFIPRRAADVCNKRYGDCKDMASLLSALLQIAGLDAHFTWIGTRDIPYDYTDVALPIVDNHMIAALHLDDRWIFLDATDPNCIFGFPSGFIQGKQALVAISDKEYKVLRVPEMETDKNAVIDSTFISISGDGIKGSSSVYYKGYFGINVTNDLYYRDMKNTRDYVKTRMGKASNKFILGDYKINKVNETQKEMNISANFEIPGYGKKVADELYINLNLEKFFTDDIIDTTKRKLPKENDFKYVIKQYTILDIPEGYTVNYLPKDFSCSNDLVGFSISYKQDGRKIITTQEIRNNYLLMQPTDFAKWNDAVKQLNTQYKEQIVLEKK